VTRGAPGAALRREAGTGAHGTRAGPGAALSREVGTGAAVTRGAPEAVLRGPGAALSREVGTRAAVTRGAPGAILRGLRAALSREVGTGATVTRGAPELPCAGRQALPRAGLLLVVSGDFFVASYYPTKHSRVLKNAILQRSRRHRCSYALAVVMISFSTSSGPVPVLRWTSSLRFSHGRASLPAVSFGSCSACDLREDYRC
jgi:hypothetical protein